MKKNRYNGVAMTSATFLQFKLLLLLFRNICIVLSFGMPPLLRVTEDRTLKKISKKKKQIANKSNSWPCEEKIE